MAPAQPPPPTASYLPFQFEAGNQTSALMSESELGVSVARTRQKAGTSPYIFVAGPRPAPGPRPAAAPSPPRAGRGGSKAPAATVSAESTFACGSASDLRFSHEVEAAMAREADGPVADARIRVAATIARTTAKRAAPASFMNLSFRRSIGRFTGWLSFSHPPFRRAPSPRYRDDGSRISRTIRARHSF